MLGAALGALQFAAPKGTPTHRAIGYIWVALLASAAASGFFIYEIRLMGPFSPIHLLSAWALWSLWLGVRAARQGNLRRHRAAMTGVYFGGLMIAGAFTLAPGRMIHVMVFGAG